MACGVTRAGEGALTDCPFVAHGVGYVGLNCGCAFGGVGIALFGEAPDALGLPEAEEDHGGDEGDDAGGDVHEIAVHVVGPKELGASEGDADDEDGRKDFDSFGPTDHGADEPEGHDYRGDGKDAADHGAEIAFVESGDGSERVDGSADSAKGDGCGVGDEIEGGGVEGFEAEADHERAGDGDGGAESGAAFDESAEAEGDEKELKAAVGSDGGDGLLHDFELAGLDGDVVEKDGGDDDPDNFEEAVGRAVEKAAEGHLRGHVENKDGAEDGGGGACDGAEVGANFEAGEQAEKNDNGQSGNQRREPPMAKGIINLIPSHGWASRAKSCSSLIVMNSAERFTGGCADNRRCRPDWKASISGDELRCWHSIVKR